MKSHWLRITAVFVALSLLGISLVLFWEPDTPISSLNAKEPTPAPPETNPIAFVERTNGSPVASVATPITNPPALPGNISALARNEPKDRMRMSGVRMMQDSLGVTDDQVKQLEPIMEQQRKELSAFRRETSLSRQERKARLEHMRETQEAQRLSVLTPEQFEQWRKGPLNLQASEQHEPELWITTHPTNATASPSRQRLLRQHW